MKSQSYIKPDKKKMLDLVSKRYARMEGKIPYTIKKLSNDENFKKTFMNLKKKNYPDWAIYMSLLNISVNLRLLTLQKNGLRDLDAVQKAFWRITNEVEQSTDSVPVSEVTEEKIEMALDLIIGSFLKGEGFESRRATPNIKSLREFAEKELDFFQYDLPHKKWFTFEKNYAK